MRDGMDRIIDLQARIDADWQSALTKKGHQATIVGDERNVLQALRTAPELRGLVRYDEFSLQVEFTRAPPWREAEPGARWTDDDDTALSAWLQEQGIAVRGRNVVADCVAVVAKDQCVHPVREYLESLTWDGTERIRKWLVDYLGATGNPEYLSAVGRCWLISAVARVMQPGAKADYVLVLERAQGIRKSMTAATLAVKPEWFCDSIGDLRTKDAAIQLCGKWIIELAELTSIRGTSQVEAVKAYLSRTHDVFRPPYGRRAVTIPRQCVFLGTTNERQYLRDRTGNRRFWPVRCTSIDLERFERDRDQLWAEAVAAYQAGEQWWLPPDVEALAAEEQEGRLYRSELDDMVRDYLERRAAEGETEVTTRDVFVYALGLNPESDRYVEQTRKLGYEVAAAIEAAGWERVGRSGKHPNRRTVYRAPGTKSHQDSSIPLRARAYDVKDTPNSLGTLGDPPPEEWL